MLPAHPCMAKYSCLAYSLVEGDAPTVHRLHDNKRVVQVYDYVDELVPMLARMYERRLKGYSAIGYVITQEARLVDERPAAS